MDEAQFDKALIKAAFAIAARDGWNAVNVARAAQFADLDLPLARERFPTRAAILLRFGRFADQAALAQVPAEGSVRDRLFYLVMQRIDALQAHREGVLALMRRLPAEPATALMLALATRRSMRWLLNAAGVASSGLAGELRVRGLVGIWLLAMRAWQADETNEMSATMAAVDTALSRAEKAAPWLGGGTIIVEPEATVAPEFPEDELPSIEVPAP